MGAVHTGVHLSVCLCIGLRVCMCMQSPEVGTKYLSQLLSTLYIEGESHLVPELACVAILANPLALEIPLPTEAGISVSCYAHLPNRQLPGC